MDSHILIVDDDLRIRELLQKYLVRNGFLVSIAKDAAQAKRLLRGLINIGASARLSLDPGED